MITVPSTGVENKFPGRQENPGFGSAFSFVTDPALFLKESIIKINLQNKVVVVTGASSGIGASLSVEMAKKGAALALIGRNSERLERVKKEVQHHTQDVSIFTCDVMDRQQVHDTVDLISRKFRRIDGLVYSSGIGLPTFYRNFESTHIEKIVRTNYFGLLYWIESTAPMMQAQKSGFIVGISSLAAHMTEKRVAGYTSSKAAVSNFLAGARKGFKKYGIQVITIEPGYVKTPMTAGNKKMIFPMEVEDAARSILKAIEKGKPVYRFPKTMAFFARFFECLPTAITAKF